jgi:hypothetical protein
MKISSAAVCSLLLLTLSAISYSESPKYAIGLNYPGFSIRYFKSDRTAWEAKLQAETNIIVAGVRINKYSDLKNNNKIQIIKGLEADLVSFKEDITEGYGFALEAFIGGEYSITKKLSFQLDFGPAIVGLFDKYVAEVRAGSIEFVLNLGVNYYVGDKQ